MYYVEKKGVSLCGTNANVTMLKKQRRQSEKLTFLKKIFQN